MSVHSIGPDNSLYLLGVLEEKSVQIFYQIMSMQPTLFNSAIFSTALILTCEIDML